MHGRLSRFIAIAWPRDGTAQLPSRMVDQSGSTNWGWIDLYSKKFVPASQPPWSTSPGTNLLNQLELLRHSKFFGQPCLSSGWLDQIEEFGNTRMGGKTWKADI
jgi:hypothetical protein